ncbi:hypothetical protein SAMN05216404_101128 [Nitrosospira multiformis]|uniref:Uncharacterized protein n=1 Tax=Nitrosospira multiformis TaxID=1231 RepID=A0A1H8B5A2_9PROT|nr:hypothetical protein SAMN05216404_101128 [Nitrosospira multiformis]
MCEYVLRLPAALIVEIADRSSIGDFDSTGFLLAANGLNGFWLVGQENAEGRAVLLD